MTDGNEKPDDEAASERRSLRWAKAGVILGRDPKAEVACPSCGQASLEVRDVPSSIGGIERYLSCPACKVYNVMRIAHPA